MQKNPKIFVIVLNYNGKELILQALASVFRVEYDNMGVVVVDNGSTDGSFELARRNFSKAIFIKNEENLGFSAGNNVGIKYALERRADYVLLLNYDTEVDKNFLFPLVQAMEENKKVGAASPIIIEGKTKKIWFSGGKINWFKMKSFHEKKELTENYFGSDYISGCAMMIRAKIFKKVGLLDEDYFLYWEDSDFSLKVLSSGYRLMVCPASRITHVEKSEEEKSRKVYWLVLSGLIFFKKNTPLWIRPWLFLYVRLRKIKNWFDVKYNKNNLAFSVKKAFRDFGYVK